MAADDPLRDELLSRAVNGSSNREVMERYIIILFYYTANGPSWDRQFSFLNGTSVCDWNSDLEGIHCNEEGEVAEIRFRKF